MVNGVKFSLKKHKGLNFINMGVTTDLRQSGVEGGTVARRFTR